MQIPFPQCSCLLCLPESPKHSSPNALLSDAEGKSSHGSWPACFSPSNLLLRPYPLVMASSPSPSQDSTSLGLLGSPSPPNPQVTLDSKG